MAAHARHADRPQRATRGKVDERYSFSVDLRQALDAHAPLIGGMQDDEIIGGTGFHVPVQRGLGHTWTAKSQEPPKRPGPRPREPPFAEAPQTAVPAATYQAMQCDNIDHHFEIELRRLAPNAARALLVRRLAHGSYEVDGGRVSVAVRAGDAGERQVVASPAEAADRTEPLASYLRRMADVALARAMRPPPVGPPIVSSGLPASGGSFLLVQPASLTRNVSNPAASNKFRAGEGQSPSFSSQPSFILAPIQAPLHYAIH